MRRLARTDANQAAIVRALRQAGASVQILSMVGQGCPDLLWSKDGYTGVIEVKDGQQPPSKQRLTPDEKAWRNEWQGRYRVVTTVEEALQAVRGQE